MKRSYSVRGLLKKGDKIKRFSNVVQARTAWEANKKVKSIVENYCDIRYSGEEPVQCIINKKTVRY